MASPRLDLLFVSIYPASPARYGGQRRLEGLMKELARRHAVTALSLIDPTEDPRPFEQAMRAYCPEVTLVPSRGEGVAKRLGQLRALVSRSSFEARHSAVPGFQDALDRVLSARDFDAVVLSTALSLSRHRFRRPGATGRRPLLLLDEHNVEFDLQRQLAGTGSLLRRLHHGVNWRKLRREEVEDWVRLDGVTFTSALDEQRARALAPAMRSAVVPNAVDVAFFRPRPEDPPADRHTVMFFGINDYYPNTDGILFFAREVWPLLADSHPRARLKIVGPRPTPEILALRGERVSVEGAVDDVRPHLASAAAVVVPIRVGGGTRFKVLEAMAMAKPVVSTTLGAEGIDGVHERQLLLADAPAAFAASVGRLLDDPALGAKLGQAARALAHERYSWESAAGRLESFIGELLDGAPASPAEPRRRSTGG